MKCKKCGHEFDGKFCNECGTPADGSDVASVVEPTYLGYGIL